MAQTQEINIPVADPSDPYANPAAMPSSADRAPRSFDIEAFAKPDRKQEDWRYTPIERIEEFFDVFEPSNETQVTVSMIDGSPLAEGVTYAEGTVGDTGTGIVSKPNDRVSAVEWNSGKRAGILTIDGEIDQPVLVKMHGTGRDLDAFHLSIIAADRAHADVVVEHDGDARLAEGVEITTGKDSHISTTFIQEWNKDSKHVGNQRIHVGEEASLRHSVVTLGGDVVRIRMDQDFGGEQGDLNMLGIYFVDPGEHIEHRTMVVHNHPECKSRVVYKGALDGKGAHSTWVGNALIEPTAPGTDSYELNRNLVLTPGAIADSEPNLEIENGQHHRCRPRLIRRTIRRRRAVLPRIARHLGKRGTQARGAWLLRRARRGNRHSGDFRASYERHRQAPGPRRKRRDRTGIGREIIVRRNHVNP